MKNPQIFIIQISLSDEENELLILLTKRVKPHYNNWWTEYGPGVCQTFQCLICDEVLGDGEKIVEHGKKHLTDSNLLPFI